MLIINSALFKYVLPAIRLVSGDQLSKSLIVLFLKKCRLRVQDFQGPQDITIPIICSHRLLGAFWEIYKKQHCTVDWKLINTIPQNLLTGLIVPTNFMGHMSVKNANTKEFKCLPNASEQENIKRSKS